MEPKYWVRWVGYHDRQTHTRWYYTTWHAEQFAWALRRNGLTVETNA